MTDTATHLAGIGNVPEEYSHYAKLITPGDDLVLPATHLKWYDVRESDAGMPPEVREETREFIRSEVAADRFTGTV